MGEKEPIVFSGILAVIGRDEPPAQLVLTFFNYDAIDRGEKDVEYRANTSYWRKRLLGEGERYQKRFVRFRRGYTKTTMRFKIDYLVVPRPEETDKQIELHLGKRVDLKLICPVCNTVWYEASIEAVLERVQTLWSYWKEDTTLEQQLKVARYNCPEHLKQLHKKQGYLKMFCETCMVNATVQITLSSLLEDTSPS